MTVLASNIGCRIKRCLAGPNQIPNLELWFRARDELKDLSNNGRDGVIAGTGVSKIIDTDGRDSWNFNNTGFIEFPSFSFAEAECFLILRTVAVGSMVLSGSSASSPYYPFADGHIYDSWGSTTRRDLGVPVIPDLSVRHVLNISSSPTGYTCNINGILQFNDPINTVGWTPTPLIGAGIGLYGTGCIEQYIIYSRILSSNERALILSNCINGLWQ